MDNSNYSRNKANNNHLGVNKCGKIMKKQILPNPVIIRPNYNHNHQPQVYNINKNDFRNMVQRLTGGSVSDQSQESTPSSSRLRCIRPPPLSPINVNRQMAPQNGVIGRFPVNDNHTNTNRPVESPISAYMSYLQQSHSPGLLPNPRMNGPILPSPRSPYPLLSPGYRDATPLSPIFPFSPMGLPGILGPGPGSQPPLSPGQDGGVRWRTTPGSVSRH